MKNLLKSFLIIIIASVIVSGVYIFLENKDNKLYKIADVVGVAEVEASVRVRGHFRRDGTWVQPHFRSSPNRNPFDNWSFPGNLNPHTGRIVPGNPDTYLQNYYQRPSPRHSPSWRSPSWRSPSPSSRW